MLAQLDQEFQINQSMRAGSLLCVYYLVGGYEQPEKTKNWRKSLDYMKQMTLEENDHGSNHKSLLLFLVIQSLLI